MSRPDPLRCARTCLSGQAAGVLYNQSKAVILVIFHVFAIVAGVEQAYDDTPRVFGFRVQGVGFRVSG